MIGSPIPPKYSGSVYLKNRMYRIDRELIMSRMRVKTKQVIIVSTILLLHDSVVLRMCSLRRLIFHLNLRIANTAINKRTIVRIRFSNIVSAKI